MKLLEETATNFKGIRSFTFATGGNNIDILGDNGSGKTTTRDAFNWVFLGSDSAGRCDFELKTLGSDGRSIPMLDHSVELVLEVGGAIMTLRKTLSESWVKARGSASATFSGHTTTYEINHVPMLKKEFDARIAGICDASLLRMLTDPGCFAGKIAWQERRRILLEICGDITDADVIASDAQLSSLPELLEGRAIEEHRRIIAARKTLLNNEIRTIPVRVDEAGRALPGSGAGGCDAEKLQADTMRAGERLKEVEEALLSLNRGSADAKLRLRLQTIEAAIIAEQNKNDAARQSSIRVQNKKLNEDFGRKEALERTWTGARAQIRQMNEESARLETQLAGKREEWLRIDTEKLILAESSNCPACGQALPHTQVQAAREKAQADFACLREQKLGRVSAEGMALSEKRKTIENDRLELEKSLPAVENELEALACRIEAAQAEIAAMDNGTGEEAGQVQVLKREKGKISGELAKLESGCEPERNRLESERDALRLCLAKFAQAVAMLGQQEQGLKRIEELKAREAALSDEYRELDRQTFLTEEFIRTKVRLMESKINSCFRVARFRLFEQQVNGAINEVCEVLGPDLVPYNSGLNNAARINTGIDIINTLGAYYGFIAPIFIDNAEAVTNLIDTPAQLIRLVVSEGDSTMKVAGSAPVKMDAEALAIIPAVMPGASATTKGPGF